MEKQLTISIGEHSTKGRKEVNQDFHDICIPQEPQLTYKGIAIALADGISSSKVSQTASKTSVTSFLMDYFSTPESWSVQKSAQRVITATNSWLYAQTKQSQYYYDANKGYVCTFSAMVIRSTTAHIFHVGDARIYQLRNNEMEQLTEDHRMWISQEKSYLGRALGVDSDLKIDYDTVPVEIDDIFLFMTDGVYEYVSADLMISIIEQSNGDLNAAAKHIVETAYEKGSDDNLTIQLVKVNTLPDKDANEIQKQLSEKPLPPLLEARMDFDGYKIIRELSASSRSHVYLAVDTQTDTQVVLKTPSIDLSEDQAYLERFLLEEWIAIRMNNAHLVKSYLQTRERNYIYNVTEFIDGQTLTQWMIDNPNPDIETVREIAEQIAKGLLALHRQEMIHQDLRPENIMIDTTGTVKIIDFGSTRVEGIVESNAYIKQENILGTAPYTAPEYFLGYIGSSRSDLFSLAVIVYQMITGELPYGTQVAKSTTKAAQRKLKYKHLNPDIHEVPLWVDEVLKKALEPNPYKRYGELSEFLYDLRHPNKAFLNKSRPPLLERNPVLLWKMISLGLSVIIVVLLNQ
ncbi:protein kinase [Sulfurovum sp. TSL6]|uniref:bifunctional protein-serine/threonine kinase/phosphatase n=1 Tax=Sulfurovum sp. TSL6 TaxID=2826995 RepID=UPI001CC7AD32|nr:bifunctional protein-serine/threonine kinase/phosphatase [Sulfurovum sp. TSL6]GIU01599.1 protein kinase [Sulfurovum sp. TSL6]